MLKKFRYVMLQGMSVEDSSTELRYLYLFLSRSTKFTNFKIAVEFKDAGIDRVDTKHFSVIFKLTSATQTTSEFIIKLEVDI
jgi:hypothetical protein